ncbi:MAG: UDP-N-acetylmuramate dehydrogenase [Psychromonas sp.]|jgi:UDP-N-acetylmuramate dehydrogenase|uniref:UDP-N-acetylmuramate dehydrogenase n=1 Tax=Psychromonas sp. TaxID=1884585 RepID=UPI0039E6006A
MMIESNSSLKAFNTFSIEAKTQSLFHFKTLQQLPELLALVKRVRAEKRPVLILGAGSNILFCEDFSGLVIKVELSGVDIIESPESYQLQVAAGEDWHQLVTDSIDKGIDGLENLALIPGVVGAAPVQNIGAYGCEFKDFCESVEYIDLDSGEFFNLSAAACLFGYRDSIFKSKKMENALITKVTLTLPKKWQPHSRSGVSNQSDAAQKVTAKEIYHSVCQTRSEKLPDPEQLGNAGSFFKNPVVSKQQAEHLLNLYPNMPHYPQADGNIKLAAGWLIEQANLKGVQCGGAAVHQQQALVLVNQDNACATDIVELAELVRATVEEKFNVSLDHEVRFIGSQGETNLKEVLQHVRA